MHTLSARDAVPATTSTSCLPHLVLHYDSLNGQFHCKSTSLDVIDDFLGMQDTSQGPQAIRRPSTAHCVSNRRQTDSGIVKPQQPKRQDGKLGSVIRRLFPRKVNKEHISLPKDIHPLNPSYHNRVRPCTYPQRLALDTNKQVVIQSPLAAHPLPVADSGDTAVRIDQFFNHKSSLPRGSSLPNFILTAPMLQPEEEETWYEPRDASFVSVEDDRDESQTSSDVYSSNISVRRRSRSVSAVSEAAGSLERPALRGRPSMKSLRRPKDWVRRRHNTSPGDGAVTAYQPTNVLRRRRNTSLDDSAMTEYQSTSSKELLARPAEQTHKQPTQKRAKHQQQLIAELRMPDPHQTFDFESIATAMRGQEQVNMQTVDERMIVVEAKLMDLEYAISKVQNRLPADRPVTFRRPSTGLEAASEGVHYVVGNPNETSLPKRKASLPTVPTTTGFSPDHDYAHSRARSSTSTVRPARPVLSPPPPPAPPSSSTSQVPAPPSPEILVATGPHPTERRDSVTLLTIDHYTTLVSLLRHEQAARKNLADELSALQTEVLALRPLAHSPLGNSYRGWNTLSNTATTADALVPTPKIEKDWAMIEEFRSGKPVGQRGSVGSGNDKENEGGDSEKRLPRPVSRGRRRIRPGELFLLQQQQQQSPPPPPPLSPSAASDSSSEASFGGECYTTPAEDLRFEEGMLIGPRVVAGRAF